MFKEETVLILGAGASVDFGYPTGEELVKRIVGASPDFPQSLGWHSEMAMKNLQYDLRDFDPSNIDQFLYFHSKHHETGKWLITHCLLQEERAREKGREFTVIGNSKYKAGNWYNFLREAIISGCKKPEDILNNKLSIITFNYDLSLEYYLYTSLPNFFERSFLEKFFNQLEIIHVYGKLYEMNYIDGEKPGNGCEYSYGDGKHNAFKIAQKSKIKVIGEQKQADYANELHIQEARKLLAKATNIFVLGFGFDLLNMELLNFVGNAQYGLSGNYPDGNPHKKNIYFTNLGDSERINRRLPVGWRKSEVDGLRLIKSTRDVYNALKYDFDLTPDYHE